MTRDLGASLILLERPARTSPVSTPPPRDAETRQKLRRLLSASVTGCLNLKKAGRSRLKSHSPFLRARDANHGRDIAYSRMPVPGGGYRLRGDEARTRHL